MSKEKENAYMHFNLLDSLDCILDSCFFVQNSKGGEVITSK